MQPSGQPTVRPTNQPSMHPSHERNVYNPSLFPSTVYPSFASDSLQLNAAYMNAAATKITINIVFEKSIFIFEDNFVCSTVFVFLDANSANCSAVTMNSRNITFEAALDIHSKLHVGAIVGLDPKYGSSTIAIRREFNIPISSKPVIIGIVPTLIQSCTNLKLDFTSSYGQLSGKQWYNSSISVVAAHNQTLGFKLDMFLKLTDSPFTRAMTIPNTMLLSNAETTQVETLIFSVEACNVLLLCTAKTFIVSVSYMEEVSPVVSIAGTSSRSITTDSSITIYSTAYIPLCGDAKRITGLKFQWRFVKFVDDGEIEVLMRSSTSSKMTLSPYSLQSGYWYRLDLTVTDVTTNKMSLPSSILIQVIPSNPILKVLPSSLLNAATHFLRMGTSLLIDASSSIDPNNESDNLSFAWKCEQYVGSSSAETLPCMIALAAVMIDGKVDAGLRIYGNDTALNTTSRIILNLSSKDNRTTSTAFLIRIVDSSTPLISILSPTSTNSKVNTKHQLIILGRIETVNACNALWSLMDSDVSAESLNALTLTPLVVPLMAFSSQTVNLVLKKNVLQQGLRYQFSLSCGSTIAMVSVTTNRSPQGGVYFIDPTDGMELSTIFSFITSG